MSRITAWDQQNRLVFMFYLFPVVVSVLTYIVLLVFAYGNSTELSFGSILICLFEMLILSILNVLLFDRKYFQKCKFLFNRKLFRRKLYGVLLRNLICIFLVFVYAAFMVVISLKLNNFKLPNDDLLFILYSFVIVIFFYIPSLVLLSNPNKDGVVLSMLLSVIIVLMYMNIYNPMIKTWLSRNHVMFFSDRDLLIKKEACAYLVNRKVKLTTMSSGECEIDSGYEVKSAIGSKYKMLFNPGTIDEILVAISKKDVTFSTQHNSIKIGVDKVKENVRSFAKSRGLDNLSLVVNNWTRRQIVYGKFVKENLFGDFEMINLSPFNPMIKLYALHHFTKESFSLRDNANDYFSGKNETVFSCIQQNIDCVDELYRVIAERYSINYQKILTSLSRSYEIISQDRTLVEKISLKDIATSMKNIIVDREFLSDMVSLGFLTEVVLDNQNYYVFRSDYQSDHVIVLSNVKQAYVIAMSYKGDTYDFSITNPSLIRFIRKIKKAQSA